MQNAAWTKAIQNCADPQRAGRFYEELKGTTASALLKKASTEEVTAWLALLSGSEAAGELLAAHPDWLADLKLEVLRSLGRPDGFAREVDSFLREALEGRDYAGALRELRIFKQRQMLRIAARDLARLSSAAELTQEMSNAADVCLGAVYQICAKQLSERMGLAYHQEASGHWRETGFCVLGMGRLGGQELDYSFDLEVLFVYAEEGSVFKTPPRKGELSGRGVANHQYFKQLCENFVAELARMTQEGSLFRVDASGRPEGGAGPIARSLSSYENYYAQFGQTSDRMALIKARPVAGDLRVGNEFIEMVQPFRYARGNLERTAQEVAAIKARIEQDVGKAGELDRNVDAGRGGIREIELITQTLQITHGGRRPFAQNSQTLPALQKLAQYELLKPVEASVLSEAYVFLCEVEHRLQMDLFSSTRTISTERKPRERLAALMGFSSLREFEKQLKSHTTSVREIFESIIKPVEGGGGRLPASFDGNEEEWRAVLLDRSFIDPEASLRRVREFLVGPASAHHSARASDLAMRLMERFFALCRRTIDEGAPEVFLSDPDRTLARLDSFVATYGARTTLYESWTGNPSLFDLLLLLFDRSESLAALAIRVPDLVDELEQTGQLRRRKSSETILSELRRGMKDADQFEWIRKFHQAERMRIGLRDILNLADAEQTQIELTALADACLGYALEVIVKLSKLDALPFAIIGLGKLGGQELIYGSDLDVIFVAPNEAKNLPAIQKRAREVMLLLSERTKDGAAFEVDSLLRPGGDKGPIANTLEACEDYYRKRAELWEIQALTRTRFIAGDVATGAVFAEMVDRVANFSKPSEVAAWQENWMDEIHRMRLRIEKERTPSSQQRFAIKTGTGGLADAEFAAQALCLKNGWRHPNTLRALARAAAEKSAPPAALEALMKSYRKLIHVERILRRWSFEAESVLPDDPGPLYRVAVRCGHKSIDSFMAEVEALRTAMRNGYNEIFERA